ncbi:DsbA family protein [Desertibaculum subflavum]|uniref:DsbA family protein n=1 Tax=Desertibaculum subflavum TaxID=2268458 RepID=UPI000E66D982
MNREYPSLPMVGVGVVVWQGERVLMIQRGKEPRRGQWSLPGGLQELGESVAEAAAREVREETGIEIGPPVLVEVIDAVQRDDDGRIRSHYTLIDLTAQWMSGEPVAGDDAMNAAWKTLDEVREIVSWSETVRVIGKARALRPPPPRPAPPVIEFFFDVGSPWTYFCALQLPEVARRAGANLVWRPFLLGGVFKLTGNPPPVIVPPKRQWQSLDLERTAQRIGTAFQRNPHFPINTLALMRGAVAAEELGCFEAYVSAVFRAIWAEGRNMGDAAVVRAAVAGAGLDAEAILARAATPLVKEQLKANTAEAVSRGAFGSPTMFVGETMFFGQDRLGDLEAALLSGPGAPR